MLNISTLHFPEIERLIPKKGEDRLKFFKRQFRGVFSSTERKEIERFIKDFGYQPMLPHWVKRGCYGITAFRKFITHKNRDLIISAILVADLLQAYPKLEVQLVERMGLFQELQQLEGLAEDAGLRKAFDFIHSQIYIADKKGELG